MGNCQAVDAAALVIQHPSGRIERLYWPVTASEVMRTNPGHYVSLIIPIPAAASENDAAAGRPDNNKTRPRPAVRFTRVKLLRPSETLVLGHAYRLVTSQEVMKVLKAKKYAKTKDRIIPPQPAEKPTPEEGDRAIGYREAENSDISKDTGTTDHPNEEAKHARHRQRNAPVNLKSSWRPTLQSIAEGGS